MGKTTLAEELISNESRVVVLDTMGGYGKKAEVVWGRDECIRRLLDASRERRFRIACRVIEQDDMLDILDMAWELEDYLLVIEETSLVCGTPPYLNRQLGVLVRYGRHRRISQIYIARRPTEIPRDLTAQSDLIVTFHQKEPRDLQYLQACGFNPAEVVQLRNDLPGRGTVAVVGGDQGVIPLPILKRMHQQRLAFQPVQQPLLTDDEEAATPPIDEPEPASEG